MCVCTIPIRQTRATNVYIWCVNLSVWLIYGFNLNMCEMSTANSIERVLPIHSNIVSRVQFIENGQHMWKIYFWCLFVHWVCLYFFFFCVHLWHEKSTKFIIKSDLDLRNYYILDRDLYVIGSEVVRERNVRLQLLSTLLCIFRFFLFLCANLSLFRWQNVLL